MMTGKDVHQHAQAVITSAESAQKLSAFSDAQDRTASLYELRCYGEDQRACIFLSTKC